MLILSGYESEQRPFTWKLLVVDERMKSSGSL